MNKIGFGFFGLATAAFATLGACHSDAASAPDLSQVNSFIQAQAQAACDWEFKCCTDAEIKASDQNKYTTKAECLAFQQLSQEDNLYLTRLAVTEGRMRVDSTHATACIQQMSARVCNPLPGTPVPPAPTTTVDDCAQALTGTTPVGAECIYAKECVIGAHCVNDAQAVGRGVCVPFQKVGDICNADADCDPEVEQIYCAKQDFKCHVRGKSGDPCAYTVSATSTSPALPLLLECDQSGAGNLYCDPVTSTCKTLPGNGQPCLSPLPPGVSSPCNPDPSLDLTCTTATGAGGVTPGMCRAPGKLGDDCSSLPCSADLYCSQTGTTAVCAALPGLGQPCTGSFQECAKPYYCSSAGTGVPTCVQPAALGQDCSMVTCDTGLYCDTTGATRVCATQLGEGASCLSSQQCRSLMCSGTPSVCQPSQAGVLCTGR